MGKADQLRKDRSIAGGFAVLQRAVDAGAKAVLVGLSGGKDSLVTLDLVVRSKLFERVEAYFMYLVPGLRCVEDHVDLAARRASRFMGRDLVVHRVPHWDLPRMVKYGVLRPNLPMEDFHRVRQTRLIDVENALRTKTGIEWFASGQRAEDSVERHIKLTRVDGCNTHYRRVFPIYAWRNRDVFAYLSARSIPLPPRFGAMETRGGAGVSLEPVCVQWMHKHHPEDYKRLEAFFPYVGVQLTKAAITRWPSKSKKKAKSDAERPGSTDEGGAPQEAEGGAAPDGG